MRGLWMVVLLALVMGGHAEEPSKPSPTTAPPALAILTVALGKVDIRPNTPKAAWHPAKKGRFLYPGETVRTGPTGKASIFFLEGSEIRLAPRSTLRLKGYQMHLGTGTRNTIKLPLGKLWAKFLKTEQGVIVETPSAVAAIKGTEFEVEVFPNQRTEFLVIEGLLEIRNALGAILAGAATKTSVSAGKPPNPPQPIDLGQRITWEAEIEQAGNQPAKKTLKIRIKHGDKEETIKVRFKKK